MKPSVRERWERANRLASCDCAKAGYVTDRYLRCDEIALVTATWTSVHEYWNTPKRGHLISGSLALDGLSIEEVSRCED